MQALKAVIYLLLPGLIIATVGAVARHPEDSLFRKLWVLEGLWRMETGKGPLFEQWSRTDNSTLTGRSYRVNGTDTLILESIQLVNGPDGIDYVPTVPKQNDSMPVRFRLTQHENDRFVFENMEHDFPQRIIYSVVTADSLVARVEGISKGTPAGSNFYYKRVR